METLTLFSFFSLVDHAAEEVLNQDILQCHRIQGAHYENFSDDEMDNRNANDSDCESDYGDAAFLETWKDHDWCKSWNDMGMTEQKLKVM